MVNIRKNKPLFIAILLGVSLILFFIFLMLAGLPNYDMIVIISFVVMVLVCLVLSFVSEDVDEVAFFYQICLIATILIPALMFLASIFHKNNILKF